MLQVEENSPRVRIAIDGLHLFGPYGGIQHSLACLAQALQRACPDDEWVLIVPRDFKGPPFPEEAGRLRIKKTWFPGRWRVVRTLWRNLRLQALAYRQRCDLLHGATYSLPAALSLPSVVTFHDLIALTHPKFCTPGSARAQELNLKRAARVARRFIVPTQAVKDQAVSLLRLDPAVVDVIPWGVGAEFRPVEDLRLLTVARRRLGLPERFVLFVGTLEPKKNIDGLVKAFFAAKAHRKLPHSLVLAGRVGWKMQSLGLLIRELNIATHVVFTGYTPRDLQPLLYSLADLCVLPSHVEGFGLPLLEAMACGCPAVVSSAPALVEVAGGAAWVTPENADKPYQPLREAFETLLAEDGADPRRCELREKGLVRAREFTWARCAQLTRETYRKALEAR
jgi:glycosyltransferase involved in cell wall biosynthesis